MLSFLIYINNLLCGTSQARTVILFQKNISPSISTISVLPHHQPFLSKSKNRSYEDQFINISKSLAPQHIKDKGYGY